MNVDYTDTPLHDPVNAFAMYEQLRNPSPDKVLKYKEDVKDTLLRSLRMLGVRMKDLREREKPGPWTTDQLRLIGGMVRADQAKLAAVNHDIGRLNRAVRGNAASCSSADCRSEFDQLCAAKHISAIGIAEDGWLQFIISPTIVYDDIEYDMGDWTLTIRPDGLVYKTKSLRTGFRPGWCLGKPPTYITGVDSFCFGTHDETMTKSLLTGQIFQLIQNAIYCMCSVRDYDMFRIPSAFYPVNHFEETT